MEAVILEEKANAGITVVNGKELRRLAPAIAGSGRQ